MSSVTETLLKDDMVDPDTLADPYSVRTPGRTWTDFSIDPDDTAGSGTVTVDAPENIDVLLLEDAYEQYPDKVKRVFFNELDARENRVTQLHARELADAVFIHIPEGTVAADVTITTTADSGFFPHHVLVYAEDGAVAEIVERNEGQAACDSAFTEIHVGQDARIAYTKINALDGGKGYADNAATVQENGAVQWLMLSTGAALYRNSITTRLAGPHATLDYGLGFLTADDQHMDHTARVIHDADSTRCDMDSRGVVMDEARAIYRGIQQVSEDAGGTQSFQDETTVMIGDDCEADTTPQLQIDNNEVEATHAATTGHIDREDLFYMRSRGLSATVAKREIITGMFDELIETGNRHGKDAVHAKIQESL